MLYYPLAMFLPDSQLTASEVLRTFHRDEPYLFLGSAFTTVGIVAIGYCVMRRRFDALLVWLAIFAHLYGQRLWMNAGLLRMTIPDPQFFERLSAATDFLVPIPAILFFHAAGFLGRWGKWITVVLVTLFSALVIGAALLGPLPVFRTVNNSVIILLIASMMVGLLLRRSTDRDFGVMRIGLLVFGVFAICDNVFRTFKIEPYGFAVMLGCFGYVAARRTLNREEQLGEIQRELELARSIQFSLLPSAFPESAWFRIAARYVPMQAVAGDLYDVFAADRDHVGILIADVSGHGVPAALIAAMVKMAAASQRDHASQPAQVLGAMNRALCGNTRGQYVTAACAWVDADRRELRYAAAGHPAMLLLRDGRVGEVAENGLLLAAAEGVSYTQKSVALYPGDRLLLYTDGVVEARNAAGAMFGDTALSAAFAATAGLKVSESADAIVSAVQRWARSQDDDLTVLVCEFV